MMLVTVDSVFAQTPPAAEKPTSTPELPAAWGKPADTPNDSLMSPEISADGRVTSNYHVSKLPEDRAIAGLSRGGNQTAYIGMTHMQEFRYLGIFSSGFPNQKAFEEKYGPSLAQDAARLKLVYFGFGTRDPAKPGAQGAQKMLDRYGIKYQSVETPGGHVWANWRRYLSEFAPLIFR